MADILERTQRVLAVVDDLDHTDAVVVLTAALGARAQHDGKDPVEVFQRAVAIAELHGVEEKRKNAKRVE